MITFPRKHKIFRGEFQAGPFAAVFMLLLIFFVFHTSLVYIPGLPLELTAAGVPWKPDQVRAVIISENGQLQFQREKIAGLPGLAARLGEEARTNLSLRLLVIKAHPAVTNDLVRRVVDLARELKLAVDLPGGRIDLPAGDSLVIATNPLVTLAINLSGQIYYQSQMLPEERLGAELSAAARKAGRPVTLMILADRAVPYDLIIRTGAAARTAGIEQVLLATRPALFEDQQP
jgi:biopolymer transport protein ExbD